MSLPCITPGCRGTTQMEERNRFDDLALSCRACGARAPWVRDYDAELIQRSTADLPWDEAKLLIATERWAKQARIANPSTPTTT